MQEQSAHRSFGGWQRVFEHDAPQVGGAMRFGVYEPPGSEDHACPVLIYLSGLTCTEQNVINKAGAQRACAEHGLILVTPDTSPRGAHVADDEGWDLGQGAGFYVNATQSPWASHYRMHDYVMKDLLPAVASLTDHPGRGITGHSMGGHGAIVLALRNPGVFHSVSAFAPILNPSAVPWGHKAFSAYLGEDRAAWADWDATALIASAPERLPMLIDQGAADGFLETQLRPDAFLRAAEAAGHPVTYRSQPDYDHSYFFVASFIADHVAHHARALLG